MEDTSSAHSILNIQAFFELVSLPLNKYGKVAVDFCSDQGVTKKYSRSYATEEQRWAEQKDQDLVYNEFSGNDTSPHYSQTLHDRWDVKL